MIKKSKQSGFSLIELMVVIAIIAILSVIGISGYSSAMRKARDSRRKSDIQAIAQALTLYRMDNGRYPSYSAYKSTATDERNKPLFSQYIQNNQLFDPSSKVMEFKTGAVPYSYVCVDVIPASQPKDGCRQFAICAKMEQVNNGNADIIDFSLLSNQSVPNILGGNPNLSIPDKKNLSTLIKLRTKTAGAASGSNLEDWYCATSQ